MPRDPFSGERIVWTGRPSAQETPPILRAASALSFVTAGVCTLFAVVVARALGVSPAPLLIFAAWASTLGLVFLHGPRIWLAQVRYTITSNRVVWQRGPFQRSIDRRSISFARIRWNQRSTGCGQLELVRAVQAGALRRKLSLSLVGLRAPDRVWAIVRGTESVTPVGRRERPLTQRLDPGERVLWSAQPRPRLRAYLPQGPREAGELLLAVLLGASASTLLWQAVRAIGKLQSAGLSEHPVLLFTIVAAISLSALLVIMMALYLLHRSVIHPARLVRDTRYLVTQNRVLIQRGNEELHLDRDRIVDVIDTPAGDGLRNVFLVLDGPRARALAPNGAFGEEHRTPSLRPVFQAVADGDGVTDLLRPPDLPRAA